MEEKIQTVMEVLDDEMSGLSQQEKMEFLCELRGRIDELQNALIADGL
jgi:hypothetical protein